MNNHERPEHWLDEKAGRTMIEYGFEPDFSEAVHRQLDSLNGPEPRENGARDLRGLLWSSVDNSTSQDLDQIEFAERKENGDIRVLIGVADVDAYVEPDTPIDRHARKNTVTVYTETRIFPMLPERLSNDITSLREGADRLAVVADMVITEAGDVPESSFYSALVRNKAKLAYPEIGDWLEGRGSLSGPVAGSEELQEQLRLQYEAAMRFHRYRQKKGALEFETIESEAVIEDGNVKEIRSLRPNSARRLIENLMVAANVEMAEFLETNAPASLRRVVRVPERWDGIRRIAAEYGFGLPAEPDQPALAEFLEKRRNADPEHFPDLSLSIIKLIGSGQYVVQRKGEDAGGHFGLAVDDYAHSTAPNRRFTDIVVQRLVKSVIGGGKPAYSVEELYSIAEHANVQEKAARKVERKMRKVVAANVMQRHVGESFDAIVTGVNQNGTFARILRPPVDGRIEKGEKGLNVGEKVKVKVISADPGRGFIDFAAGGRQPISPTR